MGRTIRDIQKVSVDDLPNHLRHAGFNVIITYKALRQYPGIVITWVSCQRGEDVQLLFWEPIPHKPAEYRIYILNSWSLRRSLTERRKLLRNDVIAIIEQSGGYMPTK